MGFALSVLYLFLYYLTPATLLGPLAALHVELILAVVVVLVSLPSLPRAFIHKTAQAYALIGMVLAVFLSILIGVRWPGGAFHAVLDFIPNIFAYFLICLHCDSKRKLQVLVVMLMFVCVFVIAHGYADLLRVEAENLNPQTGAQMHGGGPQALNEQERNELWDMEHPYLLAMYGGTEQQIFRLRGLGEVNDPNDFGQVLVCLIPLVFIFWRPKRGLFNAACVLLPVALLLFGVYLTHSRGALLALLATAIVAARRRIGTLASLLLAGVMFAAAQALHFTGGRDISANTGSDRSGFWGVGLELLKSHPLFGVGYGKFKEACDCGHTAHNSIVVCAAELGLFGLFFWALFLFSTGRDAMVLASPLKVGEGDPIPVEEGLYGAPVAAMAVVDRAEILRLGRLLVLSLTGFLVAGLFLSRSYVLTLFLLGGMTEAVFEMAARRQMVAPRMRLGRVLGSSVGLSAALIVFMYAFVRVLNVMR